MYLNYMFLTAYFADLELSHLEKLSREAQEKHIKLLTRASGLIWVCVDYVCGRNCEDLSRKVEKKKRERE